MRFYRLILGILSVWRVTHLLTAEDGPADVVVWMRQQAGEGFWGSLMDCFYCLSLWTAAPFALLLGQGAKERLALWPALSAGAILIHRAGFEMRRPPPALYVEDPDPGQRA